MIKLITFAFLCVLLTPLAHSQNYHVKWGDDGEGLEKLLRIDDEGIYCFYSEKGKKEKITPFLVKFDNNLNRLFSKEIIVANENVFLESFFALKNDFAFITSFKEDENWNYYISRINSKGVEINTKKMFSRSESISQDGIEGDIQFSPSVDTSYILMYYNPGVGGGNYNFKGQKANEELQFAVLTDNLEPVYNRTITINYVETQYRTVDYLLSKNRKLVTYSMVNPYGNFSLPFFYDKKKGIKTPQTMFVINIFGENPTDDYEYILPIDKFHFYTYFKLESHVNGKIYLTAMCTNDDIGNQQGIAIFEINTVDNAVTSTFYPFSNELIMKMNEFTEDKFKKNDPSIYFNYLTNFYPHSDEGFTVTLTQVKKDIIYSSILELNKSGLISFTPFKLRHDWDNPPYHNSAKDFFYNNQLIFIYNDHTDNFTTEKMMKYDQKSDKFNVVFSTFKNGTFNKSKITEMGNNGYHFYSKFAKLNNGKIFLVTKKEESFRLGLIELK